MEHPTVKDNDRKTEKITQKAPPAGNSFKLF